MDRFLIAVDKEGVRVFRLLEIRTGQTVDEYVLRALSLKASALADQLKADLPLGEDNYLRNFLEVLAELGHLVTRLRWQAKSELAPPIAVGKRAARQPRKTQLVHPATQYSGLLLEDPTDESD